MTYTDRFTAYAGAFEETFEDDNWQRLEAYFTEDAEYDGAIGRAAVLEKLRGSVNTVDRQMDTRALSFDPPREESNRVIVDWRVLYTKAGCPDLTIHGVETATYEGHRIRDLHDEMDPDDLKSIGAWLEENGAKLG